MTKFLTTFALAFFLVGCAAVAQPFSISSDGFTATGSYEGGNSWNYTVSGDIPTPCHNLTVVPSVDSTGNEVTLLVTVKAPGGDVLCVQSIEHKEVSGTFTANPTAKVSISVQNIPSDGLGG